MVSSEMETVVSERQGEKGRLHQYVRVPGDRPLVHVDADLDSQPVHFRGVKHFLREVFLPQGYPSSVSADYLEYQIWDTVQAFASSLSGSLATRAVLEGVGVGSSESTPLAATLMWLIKDGTGMVGRILFAWFNGTKLDADSKKWRFFADVLNDCALTLELCAPYAVAAIGGSSGAMTGVLCVAGAAKSIVGVAGGATRAALTQHQALRGNLADVSAKDGSQETLVNLAALITSLWLLPFLDGSQRLTWLSFLIFTALHVFANLKAVKAVTMKTLNRTRYLIVLKQYVSTLSIPSVQETNRLEPVVMGLISSEKDICGYNIQLGCSIRPIASSFDEFKADFKRKNYALIPDESTKTIYGVFREECSPKEMLESYALAVFSALLANGSFSALNNKFSGDIATAVKKMVKDDVWANGFQDALVAQGWSLDQTLLSAGEWRASW